ncbi:beta-lactamase/transpeptidase-like protein [Mycena alexandri]|uniref:Beta-lactamase/transpeptidase-like protein n=1 Tax=Mycena alexandri TaxID=1745969 RepID=A0AAD6S0L3_9AGAR|nr:beta-lactamase/transpeptidase-like protein [Mycena alexandri]
MAPRNFSPSQKEALDLILSTAVSTKSTPALFFGLTTAEGPIYMHQEGHKLVDDPASDAIDEDTVFWLCSQTKLITTIAALQLIEQEKITLDTPVETVLPELANPVVVIDHDGAGRPRTTVPAKAKIMLGQLLNHSSGLDYWIDRVAAEDDLSPPYTHSYKDEDASMFFKILQGSLSGVPLKFEPGTDFGYGSSTDCAGFVVERLSGKSLEQYFQDHIFAPLGITSASFYLTPALKDRLLPLSYRAKSGVLERWDKPSVIDQDPANVRVHLGGVGLYASQKDYLTILRHLLQISAGSAVKPILSRASVDSMFRPTLTPAGTRTLGALVNVFNPYLNFPTGSAQFSCGLNVNTADLPGKRRAGSGGWGGWANTSFSVDPTAGVAVVFGTQLLPPGDKTYERVYADLENAVYAALQAK